MLSRSETSSRRPLVVWRCDAWQSCSILSATDFVKRTKTSKKYYTDSVVFEETTVGSFSTYMTWYILGYILLSSVEILKLKIWDWAQSGLKCVSLRQIQRQQDSFRGRPRAREDIPWVGCPKGYPTGDLFSWAGHLPHKNVHQIKSWVPLTLGHKIGP